MAPAAPAAVRSPLDAGPSPSSASGELRALQVDGVRAAAGQRRRLAARLPRRLRRVRRAAARRRARPAACCAARRAGSTSTCPAPGARAGGEPLQLTPVPLLEAGGHPGGRVSERLDSIVAARRRAETLARMRALGSGRRRRPADRPRSPARQERCDICSTTVPDDHRHLLHLDERRIVCACEACWALHSGDPDTGRPGMRTLWLDGFDCDDELWGMFQIPIGLAFFMRSSVTDGVVAFYPSPAGATESELSLEAWRRSWSATLCSGPGARRRGAGRQPAVRSAAVRDRADRRVLPPRRPDQVALGGHLRRPASSRPCPSSSPRCGREPAPRSGAAR